MVGRSPRDLLGRDDARRRQMDCREKQQGRRRPDRRGRGRQAQRRGRDRRSPLQIFRGVPFAAPPVADLRWREPQPVAPWPGVRQATEFAPRCMQQPLFSDMMFRSPAPSEDCLYLNVWTPAKLGGSPRRKLPVLVYVYGGGFMAGDSSEKRYDGAALARRGIVVVTINYRLGVFGFFSASRTDRGLAAPRVRQLRPARSGGGARLGETQHRGVRRGPEPYHHRRGVAGSMSVSALMASPLSRGKIAGAIGKVVRRCKSLRHPYSPRPSGKARRLRKASAHPRLPRFAPCPRTSFSRHRAPPRTCRSTR